MVKTWPFQREKNANKQDRNMNNLKVTKWIFVITQTQPIKYTVNFYIIESAFTYTQNENEKIV